MIASALAEHPALVAITAAGTDRERAAAFAADLAAYLAGAPLEERTSLVRVVAAVAKRELDDPRALCRGREAASLEAAARATATLWPWLRGVEEPLGAEEDDEEEQGPKDERDKPAPATDGSRPPPTAADAAVAPEGPRPAEGTDGAADGAGPDGTAPDGAAPEEEGAGAEPAGADDAPPEVPGTEGAVDAANAPDEPTPADTVEPALASRLADAMRDAVGGALAMDRLERRLGGLLPGLGWSHAAGALQQHLLRDLARWAELLAHLPELDLLADQLGRVEGESRRSGMGQGGSEEVIGVHFAGDAARALPSELALLGDDDTEDLFYARWAEHRLLSLELEGAGIDGAAMGDRRGPVIACLDTSGSMEGAPELAAKALLLAVVRRMVPAGRAVHALLFGGHAEITELRIDRGRGGLDAVLGFLAWKFRAGTDFDSPLQRAIELLDERDLRLADILVVTDGLGWASEPIVAAVNHAREARGVRVWSVLVGRGGPEGLTPFSDEVWVVDPRDAAAASGLLRRLG